MNSGFPPGFDPETGLPYEDAPTGAPGRPGNPPGTWIPNGPYRRPGSSSKLLPGSKLAALGTPTAVREVNRYPRIVTVNFQLASPGAGGSVLAVQAPPQFRDFLSARNSATSGGNLFIACGLPASDSTAILSLPPGGSLVLDTSIPQDDIWIGCDVATVFAVIGYGYAS